MFVLLLSVMWGLCGYSVRNVTHNVCALGTLSWSPTAANTGTDGAVFKSEVVRWSSVCLEIYLENNPEGVKTFSGFL